MWLVKVSASIPYPYDKEYRIKATASHTAVARAMREYRKEERIKGKKVKSYAIKAVKI